MTVRCWSRNFQLTELGKCCRTPQHSEYDREKPTRNSSAAMFVSLRAGRPPFGGIYLNALLRE